MIYEKPYRLHAFISIMDELSDMDYWLHLSWIYTDTENSIQNREQWIDLFLSDRPERKYLMDENEQEYFDNLPEKVTLYRAARYDDNNGFSWTDNYNKALWFLGRYNKLTKHEHIIYSCTVKKEDIICYFLNRNENELIYIKHV